MIRTNGKIDGAPKYKEGIGKTGDEYKLLRFKIINKEEVDGKEYKTDYTCSVFGDNAVRFKGVLKDGDTVNVLGWCKSTEKDYGGKVITYYNIKVVHITTYTEIDLGGAINPDEFD